MKFNMNLPGLPGNHVYVITHEETIEKKKIERVDIALKRRGEIRVNYSFTDNTYSGIYSAMRSVFATEKQAQAEVERRNSYDQRLLDFQAADEKEGGRNGSGVFKNE